MAKNNYWMKLWFEILRDPKMGMLPDRLWRRVIELFLLAGQFGNEGSLPDEATIAWHLNKSVATIRNDLKSIAKLGIVTQLNDGTWAVTNFKKRNASVSAAKRVKDFRDRQRYGNALQEGNAEANDVDNESANASETGRYQEEQKNRSTELKDPEEVARVRAREVTRNAFEVYEQACGSYSSIIAEKILLAIEEYSEPWVIAALEVAIENNKRSWSYTEAILKRWKLEGFKSDRRRSAKSKPVNQGLDVVRAMAEADGETLEGVLGDLSTFGQYTPPDKSVIDVEVQGG